MVLNSVLPKGLRVLIVDDSADDRRLLTDCLREQGYRVYVAEDGHDGIEKARLVPDWAALGLAPEKPGSGAGRKAGAKAGGAKRAPAGKAKKKPNQPAARKPRAE